MVCPQSDVPVSRVQIGASVPRVGVQWSRLVHVRKHVHSGPKMSRHHSPETHYGTPENDIVMIVYSPRLETLGQWPSMEFSQSIPTTQMMMYR